MTGGEENRGKLLDELEQVRRRVAELEGCLRKGDRGCNVADDRGSAPSTVRDLDTPPARDPREDSAVDALNRLPDAEVLFERVPIPLWYHDYSLVEQHLDDLKEKVINDFQEYFRAHPSALARCEEKLRLIDVNSSALELFKASSKQVFFDNYKKIFLQEAIEPFRDDIAGLAAGRCSNLHEIKMRTLEGDEIFVLFGWAVLPTGKHHSSQVLYSVFVITDRKRAQLQLEKSEAELYDLASMVNSAILRWKPGGEISYFNRFAEDFFGYRAHEVLGEKVTMLIPDAESSGKSLATLVEDIVSHPDRYRTNVNENVLKNGDRVWMVWTNKAVFDEQGRLVEILAVGNDITVQKNDENKLRRSHHELERLVQERTVELADMTSVLTEEIEERKALDRALYEKAADLARSNRELEQFAYVASHDLQEPLRNVTDCIHLIRKRNREKLGPDADQLMTYAENSAGRMKELINDLLRYSRIQARGK
ncbi:MAG: PAS domain S-box protein, partial [Deltaproteobacteria bacterium]